MKTKTKFLSAVALATILFASCSNDENVVENNPSEIRLNSGVTSLLRASANTQENTIVSDEIVSVWIDDAVATKAIYNANQLTADGSNNFTGNAMYFPQTGNAVDIYAIHGSFEPAFKSDDIFPAEGVEFKVAKDQSVLGDASYTNADLLYAYSKNVVRNGNPTKVSLTFYHMLSKLELAIKMGDGSPELEKENAVTLGENILLNGKFTPSKTEALSTQEKRAAMLGAATTPSNETMTLGQQTSADFTSENIVYNEAILIPQDMAGKVLTFTLANGGKLKYTIPANTKFESGKKYRYNITLNLSGLEITSSISDWEPVDSVSGTAEME